MVLMVDITQQCKSAEDIFTIFISGGGKNISFREGWRGGKLSIPPASPDTNIPERGDIPRRRWGECKSLKKKKRSSFSLLFFFAAEIIPITPEQNPVHAPTVRGLRTQ